MATRQKEGVSRANIEQAIIDHQFTLSPNTGLIEMFGLQDEDIKLTSVQEILIALFALLSTSVSHNELAFLQLSALISRLIAETGKSVPVVIEQYPYMVTREEVFRVADIYALLLFDGSPNNLNAQPVEVRLAATITNPEEIYSRPTLGSY